MLTVSFRNDGTGDGAVGNYDVTANVNGLVVWRGRVEGYKRAQPWLYLVARLVDQAGWGEFFKSQEVWNFGR